MISEKTLIEQSAFFANLSSCVYKDLAFMRVNYEGFKVVYPTIMLIKFGSPSYYKHNIHRKKFGLQDIA